MNGIPKVNDLCMNDQDWPEDQADTLYDWCWRQSTYYEAEYPELVPADFCDQLTAYDPTNAQYICSNGVPVKAEMCLSQFMTIVADFVMDIEAICGYYDESGNLIEESPNDTVCNSWADVCDNGFMNIETACTSLDSMPTDLADLGLDYFCCDVSYSCIPEPIASYHEFFNDTLCDDATSLGLTICDTSSMPVKSEVCA